jgi:hypothetical protein
MLKEYLSEAVSLLSEAVLGTSKYARAETCVARRWTEPCGDYCGECGPMKRKTREWCYVCPPGGSCYWIYNGCKCYWC